MPNVQIHPVGDGMQPEAVAENGRAVLTPPRARGSMEIVGWPAISTCLVSQHCRKHCSSPPGSSNPETTKTH